MPTRPKFTDAQIKEHVKKIQQDIEKRKKQVKKGENFTSVTPEEAEEKLKRVNSPMINWQSWNDAPLGGTVNYNVGLYNPDPGTAIWLFVHVWVGSGNVDPVVGTFLLNVDTRFPRLTQPDFAGLSIPGSGGTASLSFALKIPTTVEKTEYLGNSCLMRLNWHDVGQYLDRGVFVFTAT